jgi:hypothetical protein
MNQQQTVALVPHIFRLPAELISSAAYSRKKLSMTCKYLRKLCKESAKIVNVLYDLENDFSFYEDSIKALCHHMSQDDWVKFKFIPMPEFQKNEPYKVLCLTEKLNVPKMVDPKSVRSIIIGSSSKEKFEPDVSFFQKFPKLESVTHKGIDFKFDVLPMLSKLQLQYISFNECELEACSSVSTMPDNFTTLQHLQLIGCKWPQDTRLLLPENLKRFELNKCSFVYNLDISRPKGLKSLKIVLTRYSLHFVTRNKVVARNRFARNKFVQNEFAHLESIELDGCVHFEVDDTYNHFHNLPSLKELTLHKSSTFQSPPISLLAVPNFKDLLLKFSNSPNFEVLRIVDPRPESNILRCELAKGDKEVTVMLIFDNQLKGRLRLQRDPHNLIIIPIITGKTIEIIEEIEKIIEKKKEPNNPDSVVEKCVIC